MALRDISNFKHLQEMRDEEAAKQAAASAEDKVGSTIRTNASTEMVIKEFQRQKRAREEEEALKAAAEEAKRVEEEAQDAAADPNNPNKRKKKMKVLIADLHPGKHVTSGKAAASFTATGVDLATENSCREATEEEINEVKWKFARKLGRCVCVCVCVCVYVHVYVYEHVCSMHQLSKPFILSLSHTHSYTHTYTHTHTQAKKATSNCKPPWETSTSKSTVTLCRAPARISWACVGGGFTMA